MLTPIDQPFHQTEADLTHSAASRLPLSLLKSGQMLVIKPSCKGALIIQKSHYADFIGPGAAVGSHFDVSCTSVYVIGRVEFYAPTTAVERQQAIRKRILYLDKFQQILLLPAPLRRAYVAVGQLCRWLGVTEAQKIPQELIAQLVGVLPSTVKLAWQHPTKTRAQPTKSLLVH